MTIVTDRHHHKQRLHAFFNSAARSFSQSIYLQLSLFFSRAENKMFEVDSTEDLTEEEPAPPGIQKCIRVVAYIFTPIGHISVALVSLFFWYDTMNIAFRQILGEETNIHPWDFSGTLGKLQVSQLSRFIFSRVLPHVDRTTSKVHKCVSALTSGTGLGWRSDLIHSGVGHFRLPTDRILYRALHLTYTIHRLSRYLLRPDNRRGISFSLSSKSLRV